MHLDDQALVLRCRDGDQGAFRELVQRYQRKAYGIAFSMLQNADDAMDITQEAFIRVHRYLPRFKGTSSFYTWLYRITVNLCIDFLRKDGRAQTVDYDDALDHQEAEGGELLAAALEADPDEVLARKEIQGVIKKALQALSPKHRAIIIMREVEDLSYGEMAEVMSCSIGTIMSRLFHARRRLQLAFHEAMGEGSSRKGLMS